MHKKKALAVKAAIQNRLAELGVEIPEDGWIFRDHTHEGLTPGAWSLACEGHMEADWPWRLSQDVTLRAVLGETVFLEAINGCTLGIYDNPGPGPIRHDAALHGGNLERESGMREVMWDRWEVACLTRWYELDKDTTVKVMVFIADVSGFNRTWNGTFEGCYRYAAELHRDEDMVAQCAGVLDPARLRPSIAGESVELLAWETALGHAERMITEERHK